MCDWPVPRWPDNQDPRRGRCARPAGALRDHAGALGRLPQAQGLIAGLEGVGHVIADTAYDADPLRRFITDDLGAKPQIKQNPRRAQPQPIDWALYKERHLVECFFNRIKRFRRIALRCEKTVPSFRGFVALACAMTWLT